jgi:hypothetical protein
MSGPTSGDSLKAQAMREARVFSYQVLLHTAIDARDCRGLGEFYRQFLGLRYRAAPVEYAKDEHRRSRRLAWRDLQVMQDCQFPLRICWDASGI